MCICGEGGREGKFLSHSSYWKDRTDTWNKPQQKRTQTFILVNLVDHPAQRLNVFGQLLELLQVLLFFRLAGAGRAHDRAGVALGDKKQHVQVGRGGWLSRAPPLPPLSFRSWGFRSRRKGKGPGLTSSSPFAPFCPSRAGQSSPSH